MTHLETAKPAYFMVQVKAKSLEEDFPSALIIAADQMAVTENEVIGNLYTYLQDKTAIIITHRIFSLFDFFIISIDVILLKVK